MKYVINKIHVWSVVKTGFYIFFLAGIFIDIVLIWLFGFRLSNFPVSFNNATSPLIVLYFFFSFAITVGVAGSVFLGFAMSLYNIISEFFGGVKICVSPESEDKLRKLDDEPMEHEQVVSESENRHQ